MKVWERVIVVIGSVLSMFGLSLRLIINWSSYLTSYVALWWLFMPEPYATILSGIVNLGTLFSILLLGFLVYSLLKGKEEIKL